MSTYPSILVLDDDEGILQLFQDTFADIYEICPASGVLQATDLLIARHFDLFVADLNMPVLDGIEFIQKVRAYPGLDRMPIMVVSAHPELIERAARLPIQAILQKPFPLGELERRISETLARSQNTPERY